MDLTGLIDEARERSSDAAEPYLTSDASFTRWAAEAEAEAAIRASLLYDDTSGFLDIVLADGVDSYALDDRIWRIDRACLMTVGATRAKPMDLVGIDRLRQPRGFAAADTCGTFLSRQQRAAHQGRMLHVWPAPTASTLGTIHLAVYRTPLEPLCKTQKRLEIAAIHHSGLVDWMLYRAYSTKDGEQYDPAHAAQALADFTERFGERVSADVMRQHNERRQHTTNYGGY